VQPFFKQENNVQFVKINDLKHFSCYSSPWARRPQDIRTLRHRAQELESSQCGVTDHHQSSWPNHTEGAIYDLYNQYPGELCCFPGRLIKSMNQYETHIAMSIGLLVETCCQIEVKLKSHHSYMFRRQNF